MATGQVGSDAGAWNQASAVAAWEGAANVSDAVVRGGIGADVADEISNGIVQLTVTATAAVDITNQYGADTLEAGINYQTAKGEAAPA